MRLTTAHRCGVPRFAAAIGLVTLALVASACSGGSASSKSGVFGSAQVSGGYGTTPVLSVHGKPPTATQITIVDRGTGRPLAVGDLAVVDDLGRTWRSPTTFQNTFVASIPPDTLPVGTGQLSVPGLNKALIGVPQGSRVVVTLPPAQAFEKVTPLPPGVLSTDTVVFVFDIRGGFAGKAGPTGTPVKVTNAALPVVSGHADSSPTVVIPTTAPPSSLSVTTILQGSGQAVKTGDALVVQYVGYVWNTNTAFDSSWSRSSPLGITLGASDLLPAWNTGLVGVKVGSRVMLIAPPSTAYGAAGLPAQGILGSDTLVFVIDVLGTYSN